ncbi:DUF6531 domain-containing protein [Paenibacillus alkalitolerans]|uniref:DUF6531 domain-containing protein n=1 Tax=Paenibacillus alkalitolerans TaxID=2799335 RepID=UPI0018F45D83|nr:DUF6531 domain-containing protein [Paenibacillus alkalitolerans]
MPVNRQRTWSRDISVSNYFPEFPASSAPEDYVGEWEVEVELPLYQLAHIRAMTKRPLDGKTSGYSELLEVLKYKANIWGVNWAHIAALYYAANVVKIAQFNDQELKRCEDGQLDKDAVVLISQPQSAGNIDNTDIERIEEAYANKEGHPLAEDFDPVNLATGDFVFSHTNMSLAGLMPLDFKVTYHAVQTNTLSYNLADTSSLYQ